MFTQTHTQTIRYPVSGIWYPEYLYFYPLMNLLAQFKLITCFAFDVDGVLTNGSLLISPGGEWLRQMNIKDGYALQLAISHW